MGTDRKYIPVENEMDQVAVVGPCGYEMGRGYLRRKDLGLKSYKVDSWDATCLTQTMMGAVFERTTMTPRS